MVETRSFGAAIRLHWDKVNTGTPVYAQISADIPNNSIPSLISQIEDQVFGLVVDRPSQDLRPILQVDPSLIGCATGERWETLQHCAYLVNVRNPALTISVSTLTQRNSNKIQPSDQ